MILIFKEWRRFLPYVMCVVVALLVGYCAAPSSEPSMRQLKKAYRDTVEHLRQTVERVEKQNILQEQILQKSQARERTLQSEISAANERIEHGAIRLQAERRAWQQALRSASDETLAQTMISDYTQQTHDTTALTGAVTTPSKVAAWHIYRRRESGRLLAQNATYDSLVTLWEARGSEWTIQKTAFMEREKNFTTMLQAKDTEIAATQTLAEGMEQAARRFRRQRNGLVLGGVVVVGGVIWFLTAF